MLKTNGGTWCTSLELQALAEFASTDANRLAQNGVCFGDGFASSTDGHTLALLQIGPKGRPTRVEASEFIVPLTKVKEAVKAGRGKDRVLFVRRGTISVHELFQFASPAFEPYKEDDERLVLILSKEVSLMRFDPTDAVFPGVTQVIPEEVDHPVSCIGVDPSYLARLTSVAKAAYENAAKVSGVLMRVGVDPLDPIRFDAGSSDLYRWIAVIMPMKV